jgi:hypothetical protein
MPTLADWRASSPDGAEYPAHAWPGGYPVVYYTADGLTICARCANDPDTSDPVTAGDIYWEGPAMPCDDGSQCGAMVNGAWSPGVIESAYGDPDA